MFHNFMKGKRQFIKCGLLIIILCTLMITMTYYKGIILGILSPLAGLLSVIPVDINKLKNKRSIYRAFCGIFSRLIPLIIINLLLLSLTGNRVQVQNILSTEVGELISVDSQSVDTDEKCDSFGSNNVDISNLQNFALGNEGAKIIEYPNPAHVASLYFFNVRLPWFIIDFKSEPSVLLQGDSLDVFSYIGWQGSFVIKLSESTTSLQVLSLTHSDSEHLTKPREFDAYVSSNLQSWFYIGSFTYDLHSAEPTQYFYLQCELMTRNVPTTIRYVKIEILNNWGNFDYTTLSNIAVLGEFSN